MKIRTDDGPLGRHLDAQSRIPRVAVVGTGFVGSTTAYALLLSGIPAEIVLIDRDKRRAEGHAQDLRDAEVFTHATHISTGDFGDCCSADVTIIAAGVSQVGLQSRLDNLHETAAIVKGLVVDVVRHNPRGILLIASNPVDVLTHAAWKWSGLPPNRLSVRALLWTHPVSADGSLRSMGSLPTASKPTLSANMATAKFRWSLRPESRECPLKGPRAKWEFPTTRRRSKENAKETRDAGFEIISAKGATYYGIGAALARIVSAILRDENVVLSVSALAPISLGLGEVSLSLPAIINREGIARVLPIPLSTDERQALEASAEILKKYNATVDGSDRSIDRAEEYLEEVVQAEQV